MNPTLKRLHLTVILSFSVALTAQALDYTWDGGTGNWNAVNWNGATASGPTTAGNTATINSGNVTANVGVGSLDSVTLGSGGQLNFYNGDFSIFAYQGVGNLVLQGGTVNGGSATYNAYGASILGNVTVSGSAASTITGGSWFNINPTTTYTVADVTGSSATDLLVNTSLRGPVGSPDTTYNPAAIIKEGAGTMEVTVHSYFRGGLTLNGGTLKLSGGNGGYGFFDGAVTVNSGTTLTINSDGTGFGYNGGWKPTSVNIVGGTVNGGGNHVWGISGGVNMTGGLLQSDGFQWNYTGLTTHASADTATIVGPLNLRGDGGYSTLSANVANGAAATDLLISGNITQGNGSLGIAKSGAGAMTLSGNNSYSGQTDIQAGTLIAASSTALGVGGHNGGTMTFIQDGATLALQGGVSLDEHFHVWGSGVGGLGAVRSISGNNALTNAPGGGAGYALRSNTTVGVDADTLTVSGFYNGDGGSYALTKIGAGTLELTANSSHTGGTTVNAGALRLAAYGGNGRVSGVLTVNSGATLETTGDGTGLGYFDQLTTLNVNSGTATSAGAMHIWNLTGGINLTGSTLQSNSGVSNPSGPQLEWNRTSVTTLASATSSTIGGRINIRGDNGYTTVDLTVADGAAATDLAITAAITEAAGGRGIAKHGPGTMVLSGNNSFTGATTVNDGLVIVQNGNGIGDLSNVTLNNSSQLRLDANESVGSLAGSATSTVNIQSHTLQLGSQLGNASASYDGVISGTGALVRRGLGTQILTGNNAFSGSVTVMDGGTLSVATVAASGNQPLGTGTGNINLDGSGGGATLAITGAGTYNLPSSRGLALSGSGGILDVSAGTLNMSGDITGASNSAHFTKSGAGTFNFSGSGSWSGNFTVSGGTFNLTSGGSIPGVGVATVSGTLNINSTEPFKAASLDVLPGGAVNFDAGTLRVGGGGLGPTGRSIDNDSGSFNWGNATLAVYTTGSGEAGLTDRANLGGSPSGPAVKEGNYLSVAGSLNAPSGSTLDLGTTYLSNGLRYNQLNVSGNLTLNDGTLNIGLSPYFLRPNTPDSVTVGDWGTMVLVYAEGTMSGTFAQLGGKTVIPGIGNDGIGWTQLADREYLGGPAFDPSSLALNQWLIEYLDGSDGNDFNFTQSPGAVVLLHYKVAGSVPEPASAGLLIAGTLLLRALRRRK